MARRQILVLAAGVVLGGCTHEPSSPSGMNATGASVTRSIACAVGAQPSYFVPGSSEAPPTLLGCARLGVSAKRVEFSANLARIGGRRHACVNPAYEERGRRGVYIPAICKLTPALTRFAVRDAARPQQGVRHYAYVIWGTAGASTAVTARFAHGTAHATVIEVNTRLARRIRERSFRLFVMELPLSAACGPITVFGQGPDAIESIPPRAALCRPSLARVPAPAEAHSDTAELRSNSISARRKPSPEESGERDGRNAEAESSDYVPNVGCQRPRHARLPPRASEAAESATDPDAVMLDHGDSGPQGEPAVSYVDEDRVPRRIAETFEEFVRGLRPCNEFD